MLDDALTSGDMTAVADVSRQFFHTRAGYYATFLLGLHHFDHGRPLAGALALERLREAAPYTDELEPGLSLRAAACWFQADRIDRAKQCLVSLRQRQPTLRVTVAGREVAIFTDDSEAIPWFVGIIGSQTPLHSRRTDGWLMTGGNTARNAPVAGGSPLLSVRWRVNVAEDPKLENDLRQYQQLCGERDVPLLPALHPLVTANVLLMRTSQNLLAIDFATGKRLWESPEAPGNDAASRVQPVNARPDQSMLSASLRQRMATDMTYGTLSSDGRLVFAVEDLDLELGFGQPGAIILRAGPMGGNPGLGVVNDDDEAPLVNRLAAYDIHTGKLKWQLGGPAGPNALRQVDTFFLGPPLPLFGQLYVLGEIKGEIRLMALEAATGSVLWSQQLAVAERSVAEDPWRRYAGASPSYANGVLVCPTSAGAIVGVELSTRSLLWGCQYGRSRGFRPTNALASGAPMPSRWIDGNVSVVDGRVIATPIEANFLYCFDLLDGEVLWQVPRQDELYVACADRDKVVLVGRHAIRALRLSDGKPAWRGRSLRLPENSMPSGRGFLAGQRYFVPLSNAEVAAVDVTRGKTVQISKSRGGNIAGNLVCYGGKMISQGFGSVDAYYQLDAATAEVERKLAANPDDASALSLQGEILLYQQKRSEAIACFRRAYKLAPAPRTRRLLRDCLMEGMQSDFAAYRDRAGEVERLLDDPSQRAAYLRLMADGSRKMRRFGDAFDYCEKLIDLAPDQRPMDKVSDGLSVRRDRWLLGQLTLLRRDADTAAAAKIDAAVVRRLKAATEAGSIRPLQQSLDYFWTQPAAAAARAELVARLKRSGRLLDAEIAAGPVDEAVRRHDAVEDANWPIGKIEVTTPVTQHVTPFPRFLIRIDGSQAPYLSDLSLHLENDGHTIIGSDGWGREQWRLSLPTDARRTHLSYNRALAHARVQGHLVLVALGPKVVAIDTLGTRADPTPRMLWAHELTSSETAAAGINALPMAFRNVPWQWQRVAQTFGRSGAFGPLTSEFVCFQQSRTLTTVDLRNGETLWTREDISPGSEVFGDREYLFVASPAREEATLLRAADGERVGTRRLPRLRSHQVLPGGDVRTGYRSLETGCLATLGRRMLLWWLEGNQRVLTLVDPLEGRDLWPERRFSRAAQSCVAGREAVGVMEPDGHFLLLGLPDGRTIADAQIEREPGLREITVLSSAGQYILITRTIPPAGERLSVQPLVGSGYSAIYRGRMYAFDRQGRLQWPQPAIIENQFLLLDQPPRLPVLTFACQRYHRHLMGGSSMTTSVLCIDKRNGRTAYKQDFETAAGSLDIVGNRDRKRIDLVVHHSATIRLTFTEKPLPPGAETESEMQRTPGAAAARALWDSMRHAFDRLVDEIDDDGGR